MRLLLSVHGGLQTWRLGAVSSKRFARQAATLNPLSTMAHAQAIRRLLQDTAAAVQRIGATDGVDALHALCSPLVDALQAVDGGAELHRRVAQALGARGVRALLHALQSRTDRAERAMAHRLLSEVISDEGSGQILLMQEAGFLMGTLWVYFVPHSCAAAVVGADGTSADRSANDLAQTTDNHDDKSAQAELDTSKGSGSVEKGAKDGLAREKRSM